MSLQELIEFERRADAAVEALPFWKLPVRVVLTGFYTLIDQMIHGPVDGSDRAWVAGGETVASRMSHLSPLFVRCPLEPIPSAVECIELFNEANTGGIPARELLSYSHFCELMPEVRKKHYAITRRAGGFDLYLPSAAFEAAETTDILLSELAIAFRAGVPPKVSLRTALLTGWLQVEPAVQRRFFPGLHVDVMAELYEFSYREVVEPPILSDVGFRNAVGCGLEDFLRFRSAMLAIADFCQLMGQWHRGELQMGSQSAEVTYEYGDPEVRAGLVPPGGLGGLPVRRRRGGLRPAVMGVGVRVEHDGLLSDNHGSP